jgi:hypothetical protein
MPTVGGEKSEEPAESTTGLPAVDAAVERLLVLSRDLRSSSLQKNIFRRKRAEANLEAEADSMCHLLIKKRYPNARESLRSQLSASVHERGISLQYMRNHNKKLAYLRNNQYKSDSRDNEKEKVGEQAGTPVVHPIKGIAAEKQKASHGPETLPSEISPSVISRANRRKWNPTRSVISSGSVVLDDQGNEENYPPRPEQKGGKRHVSCTICAAPLDPRSLKERAW